ncbi:MAG TPA: proton-conducting transporter membrane subunit, partial [Nitrosomonas sp.]|nr:proton-conducting transporter membrane subunit [Nitrosomonas sp.]
MTEADFPLLSLIITIPLLGALLAGSIRNVDVAKQIAFFTALITFVLTACATLLFDADKSGFQLVERYDWIPLLKIEYLVGVDGISVLFLPMTGLLTIITMLASWSAISHSSRFHFSLLLALESVSIGVFCALDTVLFFLFWELTLPPFFFLIGLWGIGSQRRSAAMKYTLFMLAGGVTLLLAIIVLATNHAKQIGGQIPNDL